MPEPVDGQVPAQLSPDAGLDEQAVPRGYAAGVGTHFQSSRMPRMGVVWVGGVCGLRSGAAARKDAELVPLWVGKTDPALIAGLADVGVSST